MKPQFHLNVAQGPASTTLSELMGAFSYALDLTEGQPEGHSIRSCYIATQMALAMGVDGTELETVYFSAMLKDLGCSSNAARIAQIYLADDRGFKHDFKLVGKGLGPTLKFVFSRTGAGHSLPDKTRAIANILRNGPEIARSLIETRCERGADIARLLRFSEPVAAAIYNLDEHWDGSGKPQGHIGHAIPLASRLALLAQIAEVFFTNAGPAAAMREVARHAGGWLDPELCRVFARLARSPDFWRDLASAEIAERVFLLQPQSAALDVDEDFLDDIASAFGQVIDAKSPYTAGHSERVGGYFDAVARTVGIAEEERRAMRRAAILHDVGKLGVSSALLEKPGKLDDAEWVTMRGHAEHTLHILGRIGPFREMASIAAAHHERLDGSGYPFGLDGQMIPLEARIITVCDFYDALTADRPYRSSMPTEKALAIMNAEVGKAVDAQCFEALKASLH